jgi:hypothetical protein
MSRWYILNDANEPVGADVLDAAKWQEEHKDRRIVEQTQCGHVFVSTVFLGLDHSWDGGPPVLWESMTFQCDDTGTITDRGELDADRYTSHADAEAGHAAIVQKHGGASP